MGKVDGWKKMLDMLKDKVYFLEKVTTLHSLDRAMLEAAKGLVKKLEFDTSMVIEEIMNEDLSRCLYSLGKSEAAEVTLSSFPGVLEDDFSKFRKEIMKGFLSNKVQRDDQASRFGECLKGNARKLVPTSMECIDDCWSTLDTLYGDPSHVIKLSGLFLWKRR